MRVTAVLKQDHRRAGLAIDMTPMRVRRGFCMCGNKAYYGDKPC